MSGPTLEIKAGGRTRTVPLQAGLTRIAGSGTRGVDVEIDGAAGELHLWDSPPKVVRVRGEDALVAAGAMVEELDLADGIGFAWCGARFRFRGEAVLEEIAEPESGAPGGGAAAPASGFEGTDAILFKRVAAGLLVETGLADKKTAKRWQTAVLEQTRPHEFPGWGDIRVQGVRPVVGEDLEEVTVHGPLVFHGVPCSCLEGIQQW